MNKLFDKVVGKNWVAKVLALAFALLLFTYAYDPDDSNNNVNVPSSSDSVVLEDIPVKAYYDTDNVVVTGIPKTVTLTLSGPIVHLQPARVTKDFEVYVDLANVELGEQTVPLQIKDLSDKLSATIEPETITVNVKEKVTQEFKVEAEFNGNAIAEGFEADTIKVEPRTVTITGAKDVVEKIAYVKANVNIEKDTKENIRQKATVTALDNNLNKLKVQVEPETVEVNISVNSISKKVPINIIEKGTPPENITIDSITLDKQEATITGAEDVLKDIDSTRVEVDVSSITENSTLSLPVIISNGVISVDPELVTATIKVTVAKEEQEEEEAEEETEEASASEEPETKTISQVPITINGVNENQVANIVNPTNAHTNVKVTGDANTIQGLKASDFSVYLDVTGLSSGEHEVPIKVNGPNNITWELAKETASVSIKDKEA